jgi:hypothetical protein
MRQSRLHPSFPISHVVDDEDDDGDDDDDEIVLTLFFKTKKKKKKKKKTHLDLEVHQSLNPKSTILLPYM